MEPIQSDRQFMELAIEQMKQSAAEGSPRVGAVIVAEGRVVSAGCRQRKVHAERAAIDKAIQAGHSLQGATLYTTLEPCVVTGPNATITPCAELIRDSGISCVVIGRYDVNSNVYRRGWRLLRDAGVRLRDFHPDLRELVDSLNATSIGYFGRGIGPSGGARFDHSINGGRFEFQYSEDRPDKVILTEWVPQGMRVASVAALHPAKAALARYANKPEEIDDPTALDFGDYWVRVNESEIVVFVASDWCVFVRVIEALSGPRYGSGLTALQFTYMVCDLPYEFRAKVNASPPQ